MKRTISRLLSLILCGAMIGSMFPQTAFATDGGIVAETGLCEHHPEHNAECGYIEGTPGTPCNHEHTDACYEEVTSCVHEHMVDCYPQNSMVVVRWPRDQKHLLAIDLFSTRTSCFFALILYTVPAVQSLL